MTMEVEKDTKEFDFFRESYIRDLNAGVFPFEAAYYIYSEESTRIDVLTYVDFKEQLASASLMQATDADKWTNVSAPIYEKLQEHFKPKELMNDKNQVIKMV